jgi:hypothetical protein
MEDSSVVRTVPSIPDHPIQGDSDGAGVRRAATRSFSGLQERPDPRILLVADSTTSWTALLSSLGLRVRVPGLVLPVCVHRVALGG